MNRTQDLQNCDRAEAEAQARQVNPAKYWQARAYEAEVQAHELAEALKEMIDAGIYHYSETGWPSQFHAGALSHARAALAKLEK